MPRALEIFVILKVCHVRSQASWALLQRAGCQGSWPRTCSNRMEGTGKDAHEVMKELDVEQVADVDALKDKVLAVLEAHPDEVRRCKSGKTQLIGFFVGEVVKATGGKADPKLAS